MKTPVVKRRNLKIRNRKYKGSVFLFIMLAVFILSALGLGLLTIAYGARYHAAQIKNETVAMLAAEAGYEKAVFWMGQQADMVSVLQTLGSYSDSIAFPNSSCNYEVSLFSFIGARPVYRIFSNGLSGKFARAVDVLVVQAIGGWEMGMCRVPTSSSSTSPVNFTSGEVIDMPVHINKQDDWPDERDIFFIGNPEFMQTVSMGESQRTDDDSDKYAGVMDVFDEGIDFDQPNCKVTDETSIQFKIDRFESSTKSECTFTPLQKYSFGGSSKPALPAVQLEFFVDGGVGKVRITNNCTVRGFKQSNDSRTYDFKIKPGTDGEQFERYNIYAYHVVPSDADVSGERVTRTIESTYVTQTIGGVQSEPGGQIYVDGNVIIGGNDTIHSNTQIVKGKITVVATGNIWVADTITVDGSHDVEGMPTSENENAIGLISQGVVKVVDPGMTTYSYVGDGGQPIVPSGSAYAPIGFPDTSVPVRVYKRYLQNSTVVESAVTVGGGGWGAENVKRSSYGGRKEYGSSPDDLILRGTIAEAIRGVVGLADGSDGFSKLYYFDERFLEGILPGDMWLRGKFIPAPAGWNDYKAAAE